MIGLVRTPSRPVPLPLETRTTDYGKLESPDVLRNVYSEPHCTDTAVCMVYFNAVGYVRPRMNFLLVEQGLRTAKIPLFTAECVIGDQPPFLTNPTLRKHSKSALFFKECLFNRLEPLIPSQYTKLIFMDADVLFDRPDWVDAVSKQLDTCDVLQPFSKAHWLAPDYTTFERNPTMSFVKGVLENIRNPFVKNTHEGFAWAMTRSFFQSIGGFYEKMLIGSGDTMFSLGLVSDTYMRSHTREEVDRWWTHIRSLNPKLGYIEGNIYHLGHGSAKNRNYVDRHHFFSGGTPSVHLNEEGIYELDNPEDNDILLAYFRSRQEDQT